MYGFADCNAPPASAATADNFKKKFPAASHSTTNTFCIVARHGGNNLFAETRFVRQTLMNLAHAAKPPVMRAKLEKIPKNHVQTCSQ
jgi:hypothetical protein